MPESRFRCLSLVLLACLVSHLAQASFADPLPSSLSNSPQKPPQGYPTLGYTLLGKQDYPSTLFTQGLVQDKRYRYISSGLYGKSKVLKQDLAQGSTVATWRLPRQHFAEGITLFKNKLYLLSWKSGRVWQLNRTTLKPEQTFSITGEGWGITHNDQVLITSDGSDRLQFRTPDNLSVVNTLAVTDKGQPLFNLNELEFAEGIIWANIWKQTRVVGIDPHSGKVIAEIDLTDLVKPYHRVRKGNVLNGIAWDSASKGFWISGKRWPTIFLVQPDGIFAATEALISPQSSAQ